MKKRVKISTEKLQKALEKAGYTKIGDDEWRRKEFHLFIHRKGKNFILSLHEDVPSPYPPFHRARYAGKRILKEMERLELEWSSS